MRGRIRPLDVPGAPFDPIIALEFSTPSDPGLTVTAATAGAVYRVGEAIRSLIVVLE